MSANRPSSWINLELLKLQKGLWVLLSSYRRQSERAILLPQMKKVDHFIWKMGHFLWKRKNVFKRGAKSSEDGVKVAESLDGSTREP